MKELRTWRGNALRARALGAVLLVSVGFGASSVEAGTSPRRAFFMSLLLPGWGQASLGTPRRAAVFASVEGVLLLSGIGFRSMRGIYEDDYRAFAASVAGANVHRTSSHGNDRTYFSDLAFYDTRTQHNQVALAFEQPEPKLYPIEDDWQWPTTEDRLRYRHQFNRAKTMDQCVSYVLFAVSLNHLASAIDAARQASKQRKAERTTPSEAGLRVIPLPEGGGKVEWVWAF